MKMGLSTRYLGRQGAGRFFPLVLSVLVCFNLLVLPALASPLHTALLPGFVTLHAATYPIGPGAFYEVYHLQSGTTPLIAHVVRLSPHEHLELGLSLPQGQAQARETVGGQVARNTTLERPVIAAINGDFFLTDPSQAGLPMGLTVQCGELIRHPSGPAFGLLDDWVSLVGAPQWVGLVRILEGEHLIGQHQLHGINTPRQSDQLILFTPAFGQTTQTNEWGREVMLGAPLQHELLGGFSAEVLMVSNGGNSLILADTYLLSGHGLAADFLQAANWPGRRIEVIWTIDAPWHEVDTAVGGGPILLKDGVLLPDGLTGAPLPHQASPRSAIASTEDGTLLLVAVDGRQPSLSAGLSLADFALLLKQLGACDALNLDGGGSTTMMLRPTGEDVSQLVNSPSDGRMRAVGNALLVFSSAPKGSAQQLFIKPITQPLLVGSSVALNVIALDAHASAATLPPGEVHWGTDANLGTFDGRVFTSTQAGYGQLTAGLGDLHGQTPVHVVGPEDVATILLQPGDLRVQVNERIPLVVTLLDQWGRVIHANQGGWRWEVTGTVGLVSSGSGDEEWFTASEEDGRGLLHLIVGDHSITYAVTVGDPSPFLDVRGHWSEAEIRFAAQQGWIQGYPDETFRPDHAVTRGEFVKLLVTSLQVAGTPAMTELPFTDEEPIGEWLLPFLLQAVEMGWITGFDDGTFRPGEPLARQAAATILMRALGQAQRNGETEVPFLDAQDISNWALAAVSSASKSELLRGFEDNTFRPHADMTRAQTVTLLTRSTSWQGGSGT